MLSSSGSNRMSLLFLQAKDMFPSVGEEKSRESVGMLGWNLLVGMSGQTQGEVRATFGNCLYCERSKHILIIKKCLLSCPVIIAGENRTLTVPNSINLFFRRDQESAATSRSTVQFSQTNPYLLHSCLQSGSASFHPEELLFQKRPPSERNPRPLLIGWGLGTVADFERNMQSFEKWIPNRLVKESSSLRNIMDVVWLHRKPCDLANTHQGKGVVLATTEESVLRLYKGGCMCAHMSSFTLSGNSQGSGPMLVRNTERDILVILHPSVRTL